MKSFLSLAVLVAVATCAAGLAVMSVDFGSEFMKIAIVKPGVPMEIAYNKESKRKTPVVVAFKDGERLFGDPALTVAIRYPSKAYSNFLDLLGKRASNPIVKAYQERYPYYNIEDDADTGLVVFRHDEETTFTVEELVGMVLEKAKEIASDFAEQPVTEAVVTVPSYFNQAERRAMLRAGELAGLKILQLLNDNTAVALNYGVFRRKEFNGTAVNYIFFDMGSSSTTATIASYQVVKAKNPATQLDEMFPQVSVKGVGFDRTLGGAELQLRLRDHLAKVFTASKKTSSSVYESPRALAKLYKEAGRLKQVLSANTDHTSQVEGLLDDEDFRAKVTRAEFEDMNEDLFLRIDKVIQDALKSSEITMGEITEVILMGGSTRVPRVQEEIQKSVERQDLGKSINTDEAAALGASYQSAHLSKGYKVKKFGIKDANVFPIQVEFERVKSSEDNTEASKMVKRTLFGRMNAYPQKKVMTFNKHTTDFRFQVNYGDMDFLGDDFLQGFGKLNLQEVALLGIEDAHSKHGDSATTKTTAKGTKAHFRMDDNGILTLDKVESIFEKLVEEEVEEKEESTLSKIGNTISSFFGSGEKKADGEETVEESAEKAENSDPATEKADDSNEDKAETKPEAETQPTEEKPQDSATNTKTESESPKEPESTEKAETSEDKDGATAGDPASDDNKSSQESEEGGAKADEAVKTVTKVVTKTVTVKEEIKSDVLNVDLQDPSSDNVAQSRKKISELRRRDEEKAALELARNELESFVFDTQDKLYQEEYEKCTTEEERQGYQTKLSEASDWLDETDSDTDKKAYKDKLRELQKETADMFERVREREERPRALEALNSIVNYTEFFLLGMRNLSAGEDAPFTEVEVTTLEKLITDTKEWNTTVHEEQAQVADHEKPKLLVADIGRKINDLDREVKYLLNKMKTFRPKVPKDDKKADDSKKKSEEKKSTDDKEPSDATEGDTQTDTQTDTQADTQANSDTQTDTQTDSQTKDSEKSSSAEEEETLQLPASDEDDKTEETTHDPNEL